MTKFVVAGGTKRVVEIYTRSGSEQLIEEGLIADMRATGVIACIKNI